MGDYDVTRHNCCHFCKALLAELGAIPMPEWIMSLAGVAADCANHVDRKEELGRLARGARPLEDCHMGDYTRGAIASLVIKGKQAAGKPATPTFHWSDLARGMNPFAGAGC